MRNREKKERERRVEMTSGVRMVDNDAGEEKKKEIQSQIWKTKYMVFKTV